MFIECPWACEGQTGVFCYECHEELLHNPVFLPQDIERFAELVERHGLNEQTKPEDRGQIAGRVMLLRDVIATGLQELLTSRVEA